MSSRALVVRELAGIGCLTFGRGAEIACLTAEEARAVSITWSEAALTGNWPAPERNTATLIPSRIDIGAVRSAERRRRSAS